MIYCALFITNRLFYSFLKGIPLNLHYLYLFITASHEDSEDLEVLLISRFQLRLAYHRDSSSHLAPFLLSRKESFWMLLTIFLLVMTIKTAHLVSFLRSSAYYLDWRQDSRQQTYRRMSIINKRHLRMSWESHSAFSSLHIPKFDCLISAGSCKNRHW